ncbi:MAG: hypothetical protein JF602_06225 [Gemmatimonadetes bacterium]|nr:hypothetical protein [Gemmatimonadota bacterium]
MNGFTTGRCAGFLFLTLLESRLVLGHGSRRWLRLFFDFFGARLDWLGLSLSPILLYRFVRLSVVRLEQMCVGFLCRRRRVRFVRRLRLVLVRVQLGMLDTRIQRLQHRDVSRRQSPGILEYRAGSCEWIGAILIGVDVKAIVLENIQSGEGILVEQRLAQSRLVRRLRFLSGSGRLAFLHG